MRTGLTLSLFTLLALAPCARAEDAAPYTAHARESAYVRSGPGQEFYPTDKLPAGATVEVYRQDDGGWLAIRPPEHSFSWISAKYVKPASEGMLTVTKNQAAARVGSIFSEARDVVQVHLDPGEKVTLLGAVGSWRKIAPPPGEFRWIAAASVERNQLAAPNNPPAPAAPALLTAAMKVEDHPAPAEDPADQWRPKTKRREGESRSSNVELAGGFTPADRGAQDVSAQLNGLNIELSAIVTRDASIWSLSDLRARTESLLTTAQSPGDRAAAQTLLSRIDRFQDIKTRHDTLAAAPIPGMRRDRPAAPVAPTPALAARTDYDGVGRLERIALRTMNGPQFALLDAAGGIVCYVTPAPGVNLNSYQNHQIGVSGSKTFLADLGKQDITAQRVTLLVDVGGH